MGALFYQLSTLWLPPVSSATITAGDKRGDDRFQRATGAWSGIAGLFRASGCAAQPATSNAKIEAASHPVKVTGVVQCYRPLPYTIVHADVAGSGILDDREQLRMRASLHTVFDQALCMLGIEGGVAGMQDLGDGIRLIVDARVSPNLMLDPFVPYLSTALRQHRAEVGAFELRLRVVVHLGLLHRDRIGWAGAPLVHCARLLDAEPVRRTLSCAKGTDLALVVSHNMYDMVVQHGYGLDRTTYCPVFVTVKETATIAWVHVPGYRTPPGLATANSHAAPSSRAIARLSVGVRRAVRSWHSLQSGAFPTTG